jgi:hypothetical protein
MSTKNYARRQAKMFSKNSKFVHVFAIIRVDTFQEEASLEGKM